MALSLSFFGGFHVAWSGLPITFKVSSTRALMAYLAAEAGQTHSREQLAALLWPDHGSAAAFTNLRQTLARVRKAIPNPPGADAILHVSTRTLQFRLRPDVAASDFAAFERLLSEVAAHTHTDTSHRSNADVTMCPDCIQRLRQAIELYRGEFLHGLFSECSQPFEEWMLLRRERLHQQALAALHTLTCHAELIGDYERTRDYASRQLALEPWREEAHAQLMRALALSGQRAAALAQFEACCRILERELGIGPGNDLRALAERIRNDDLSAATLAAELPRHNLPEPLTPFVGREGMLADVAAQLKAPQVRLLTLTGPGGIGKTRLAIEAGRARLDDFPDGVFFVPLAPLGAASAIVPAIATAIGLSLHGDPKKALLQSLRNKRTLLILDNFEHVLSGPERERNVPVGSKDEGSNGAAIVVDMLQAAPQIKVIATSRERLDVRGEHVAEVRGMGYAYPADDVSRHSDLAVAPPAVQLFVQSARRAQMNFALSETNLPAVFRICRLVDGMPLGLELAAAWVGALPLDAIATEIGKSIDFLAADWPDAPERQRSLRAVFDWSWALLTDVERQTLGRLSVFRGGFTREAAEAVAGASLRTLNGLIHKSLLRWGEVRGTSASGRYEIHELLRQFAAGKLTLADASTPDAMHGGTKVSERHSAYFLAYAGRMAKAVYSGAPYGTMAEVQADIDNIRQAFAWAIAQERLKLLHDHTPALSSIFSLLGLLQEGERLMASLTHLAERALAGFDDTSGDADKACAGALAAKALVEQARYLLTQYRAQPGSDAAQRALAHARRSGDSDSEAGALLYWGNCLLVLGDVEQARQILEQAFEVARATPPFHAPELGRGTPTLQPMILTFLATVAVMQDRDADAMTYGEQSLSLCTGARDWLGKSRVAYNLGSGYVAKGRYGLARRYYEQALMADQNSGGIIYCRALQELGRVALYCGDYGAAESHLRRALAACGDLGDTMDESITLSLLSRSACYQAAYSPARDLAERSAQLARDVGNLHLEGVNLCNLGAALAGLHRWDEAATTWAESLARFDAVGAARDAAEPRAGLASIALAQHDLARAMMHVEAILPVLGDCRQVGLDEPFFVCLVCHRVLAAADANDPRAATVLNAAHALLTEYARHRPNDASHDAFVNGVPTHRELARHFNVWTASAPPETESIRL